tara:strand:+ start:611 stop:1354 length:744 start_codon:yes stop_codon:yes gene_type:complete
MKLQDKENLDIASAVSDVLEGKKEVKEISYPHKMYSKDGKDEVEVKNEDEHNEYVKKGYVHKKPEVSESPDEPKAKGEKEFKDKHKVKKSGMNNDGTVTKESKETVSEKKKPGRGKTTIDIDFVGDKKDMKDAEKKYKLKFKITGRTTADVTGEKKNLLDYLTGPMYGMDPVDVEDLFSKIFEGKEEGYMDVEEEELSPKQKKYQAFFKKALKKFGVESPAELDKEKRKEFFDYVDKNYDAGEGETD